MVEAMGYGVFVHRQDSIYDDSPAERYQFPGQYLKRVADCIGDWIIYYEPRKVPNTRGYFALARVERVVPDPTSPGMYLALIEEGSYLDFGIPVPFSIKGGVVERGVLNAEGGISGRVRSAVRPLNPTDFTRILALGLEGRDSILPREDASDEPINLSEEQDDFEFDVERDRVTALTSRPIRDRAFRQVVLRAYEERCAISGLRLINGRGRAEVAAAHIKPVEANGPDCVNNGIALSGTAHWMFDRGLISLSDDLDVLISRQTNDPAAIRAFVNSTGRAFPPAFVRDRPHPRFLDWHRTNCFKA